MKLTIINGSPKPGKNNTGIMINNFVEGFKIQTGNEAQIIQLNRIALTEAVQIFEAAEVIMLAFPLYTHAMPGGVKLFIEALEPLCGKCRNKKLMFLVQYGFREAIHARPLERYLEKLAGMLGCEYLGTIIKGGCDGLSSGKGGGNILKGISALGVAFGKTGKLDQTELDAYSAPEFEKKQLKFLMSVLLKFLNKHYWGAMLKKNKVTIEESFAKPLQG